MIPCRILFVSIPAQDGTGGASLYVLVPCSLIWPLWQEYHRGRRCKSFSLQESQMTQKYRMNVLHNCHELGCRETTSFLTVERWCTLAPVRAFKDIKDQWVMTRGIATQLRGRATQCTSYVLNCKTVYYVTEIENVPLDGISHSIRLVWRAFQLYRAVQASRTD